MVEARRWTDDELEALKTAYAQNVSVAELADRFERSRGSVRGKIVAMGLHRGSRPWTAAEREQLRRWHDDGLATRIIARRLERTPDAITRMCNRMDLRREANAQSWTPEQVSTLETLLMQGESLATIARATGHPRSSVADKLRQMELISPRFRRGWSAQERHTLRTLHAAGADLDHIAAALPARSLVAIRLKLRDLSCRITPLAAVSTHMSSSAPELAPPPTAMPAPSPVRRLVASRHAPAGLTAPRTSCIPASFQEMERWLRTRDYMVVRQGAGWVVDRHVLDTENAFLAFVNDRRRRFNLPVFMRMGGPVDERPLPVAAPASWRSRRTAAPLRAAS